jgi:hypothetical protein
MKQLDWENVREIGYVHSDDRNIGYNLKITFEIPTKTSLPTVYRHS